MCSVRAQSTLISRLYLAYISLIPRLYLSDIPDDSLHILLINVKTSTDQRASLTLTTLMRSFTYMFSLKSYLDDSSHRGASNITQHIVKRLSVVSLLGVSAHLLVVSSALGQPSGVSLDPSPVDQIMSENDLIDRSLRPSVHAHPALRGVPRYRIDVELDLDLWVYHAQLRLEYTNQERDSLKSLNFLLYPNSEELSAPSERRLIITDAKVNGVAVPYDRLAREVLEVPLATPLKPRERVRVDLSFKGSLFNLAPQPKMSEMKLEDILQSVIHKQGPQGGYGVFSQGDGIVSMALWYPVLVAYDEHGWDVTPSSNIGDRSYFDVAHYDVSVTTESDALVATTGVEVERQRRGRQTYARYAAAGVREFTIQASRDYTQVSAQHDDVTVRSFVSRRHQSNNMPALKEAISALESFEAMYGPYPYRELEIAESPLVGGAGGVEFPGLITIGSTIYGAAQEMSRRERASTRPSQSQRHQKISITGEFMSESRDFVIAHEVAHQWWNAVVGSDSRRHPFVDEALANYSAAAHFARTRGPTSTQRQIDMMMRLNYHLARLTGMKDQAVDLPTTSFKGILEYGAIVYGKGALFFWELRERLGEQDLHELLSAYYHKYTFRVATGPELRDALARDSQTQAQVRALIRRWLDERHGDEDIAGVSLYRTLKIMMGDLGLAQLDPELRRWLNHRGVDALAELLEQALRTGKIDNGRVDYGALTSLLADLMSDDPRVARWAGVASRVLRNPDAQPGDVLREAGREIKRDDPKAGLILESAGLLLDAIMMEDQVAKKKQQK
jgi:hypothetical protein